MYVCICRSVTERDIRRAIGDGACRMRELRKELGVCAQCGKCAQSVRELLDEGRHHTIAFATLKQT